MMIIFRWIMFAAILAGAVLLNPLQIKAEVVHIGNESLEVGYDGSDSTFTVRSHGSDTDWISKGHFSLKGEGVVTTANNPTYGIGQSLCHLRSKRSNSAFGALSKTAICFAHRDPEKFRRPRPIPR